MKYDSASPPPDDWPLCRHSLPAVFRSTFSYPAWWTAEQQQAIRAALDGWATSAVDHPLDGCYGYTHSASTKATPAVQRVSTSATPSVASSTTSTPPTLPPASSCTT